MKKFRNLDIKVAAMGKVKWLGMDLNVHFHRYLNSQNLAIQLMKGRESLTIATVNTDGLSKDEVAIKNYSENTGVYEALLEADIIESAHNLIESGMAVLAVCTLGEKGKALLKEQGV